MMNSVPKVTDIEEEEDNSLNNRIRLTKNEYYATIRNKLELNRLNVIRRHLEDENDLKACRIRSSIHEVRREALENKKVVCKIDEFVRRRNIRSALSQNRTGERMVQSSCARLTNIRTTSRAKSASTLSRPYTAPLQPFYDFANDHDDSESDDEALPISVSRLTSAKRPMSVISTQTTSNSPLATTNNETQNQEKSQTTTNVGLRITWPVTLKVFSLQDENEFRQEYLTWRAEKRKVKSRPVQPTFIDADLEEKYQQSIRRRQEIEAYLTPELIRQYKSNDPIFAKRHRQLKLAFRSRKVPTYDPHDLYIHGKLSKSNIERARSALATSQQKKIQNFYRTQQNETDLQLSKRITEFLFKLEKMKENSS